jgi:hypothetical protein
MGIFEKLFNRKKKQLICQKCRQPIAEPSYVIVRGDVITNSRAPRVFTCPEQAFNYAQGIIMHTICWIETLREYGTQLLDLHKVYAEYNRKAKRSENGLG